MTCTRMRLFLWCLFCCGTRNNAWLISTRTTTTTTTRQQQQQQQQRHLFFSRSLYEPQPSLQPPNSNNASLSVFQPERNVTMTPLVDRFPLIYSIVVAQDKDASSNVTTSSRTTTTTAATRWSNLAVTMLAVMGCTSLLNQALCQWEWMQAWRYTWPFGLGALYMWQGWQVIIMARQTSPQQQQQQDWPFILPTSINLFSFSSSSASWWWWPWSIVAAGLGLILGGAADAWLPVYVTGPNLFTAAGLAPDAATYLMAITLWSIMTTTATTTTTTTINNNKTELSLWQAVLLLSQLYILGAGSLNDAVTQTTDILANAAVAAVAAAAAAL